MVERILVLHENDNVGVALCPLQRGKEYPVSGGNAGLRVLEDIPFGHKVALTGIAAGEPVLKYGEVIATAARPVERGAWVHNHNLTSEL